MSAINAFPEHARRVLLDVMVAVAWADQELRPEEREAVRGAATALGLVLPEDAETASPDRKPLAPEEFEVGALTPRDREIVYLCAAWMAVADSIEQPEETDVLRRLQARLAISDGRARWLKAHAIELRISLPPSPSWWRTFDRLLVRAAQALT
jgi:aspartate ammonia-lyase